MDAPVFSRTTTAPAADTAARLTEVAKAHGFGTLHTYNLGETLASKGFPQPDPIYVLEVCNPAQANKVLSADPDMNLMLPCRISVYGRGEETVVAMARPLALLAIFTSDPALVEVAREVGETMEKIIEETVDG